jgi:hypothetical protein
MTRVEAAAFVEALDAYLIASEPVVGDVRVQRRWGRILDAARERLIDRLCGDEGTQPLAGSAK